MAENESLDIGSSYAKRWTPASTAFQNGDPCEQIASKFIKALCGGLRSALKQFRERGVPLSDLLAARGSRQQLQRLVRLLKGHQYARLFESAAHASGPTAEDCLRGWMHAIQDTISDQLCLRATEREDGRTSFDLQGCMGEVLEQVAPDVERIVTRLASNPDWRPQRESGQAKAQDAASPTVDLMGLSLL